MPKVRDGGYMSRVSLTRDQTSMLASRLGGPVTSVHDLCVKVAADPVLFGVVSRYMTNPLPEMFACRHGDHWSLESPYGSPYAFVDAVGLVAAALSDQFGMSVEVLVNAEGA